MNFTYTHAQLEAVRFKPYTNTAASTDVIM